MYTTITIKDKDYKLRLTTKACVEVEQRLGTNPLNIFMKASNGEIPKLDDLLVIWHGSMTSLNNGISLSDMYDIYDDYCEQGGSFVDLIKLLVQVFQDSGFIPKETKQKN